MQVNGRGEGGEEKVRGGGKEEKEKKGGKEPRQHAVVGVTPFLELPAEGWRAYRNGGGEHQQEAS